MTEETTPFRSDSASSLNYSSVTVLLKSKISSYYKGSIPWSEALVFEAHLKCAVDSLSWLERKRSQINSRLSLWANSWFFQWDKHHLRELRSERWLVRKSQWCSYLELRLWVLGDIWWCSRYNSWPPLQDSEDSEIPAAFFNSNFK